MKNIMSLLPRPYTMLTSNDPTHVIVAIYTAQSIECQVYSESQYLDGRQDFGFNYCGCLPPYISNVQGYKLIQRAESERDMIHILTCHVTVGRQQGRHGYEK